MNIYDLKLYGVCYPRLIGDYKVVLSKKIKDVHDVAPASYRFEVMLLKQYENKNDVFRLHFKKGLCADEHIEYVTLNEPSMRFKDGKWHATASSNLSEAFLTEYNEVEAKEALNGKQCIFDLKFYGLVEQVLISLNKVNIFFSKANRDKRVSTDCVPFTATVLKEYAGRRYVIKCEEDEKPTAYITLFDSLVQSEKNGQWVEGTSDIPKAILEFYMDYLNE